MKTTHELLTALGLSTAAVDDKPISALSLDSRVLNEQMLWLATRGTQYHALDFYTPEINCAAIFYEPPYQNPPPHAIAVERLSEKVSAIADLFYDHPTQKLWITGVTGTDGKSSLVHFIAQATGAAMLGTIGYGNLNALQPASHTTPDAITTQQQLAHFVAQGNQAVAMEISSHALAQHRVAAVAVDVAVFTNLSRDHLDYHADMEDYFLAKAQLFAFPIKHAVINIDDPHGRRLISEHRINSSACIWAVSAKGAHNAAAHHNVCAHDYCLHQNGVTFTLAIDDETIAVETHLLARFNLDNVLNVAACLAAQGFSLAAIAEKLNQLHGVIGRVEPISLSNQAIAIVDYAHTAGAIESVLTGIRPHISGKLWLIFGCGGNRDRGKRALMAQAAERFADAVIVTDDNPRTEDPAAIIADVMQGFEYPEKIHVIQPREQAIHYALAQLHAGDAVLITGKGHEDYQIIGTTKYPFSDQAVIKAWINS